MKIVVLLKQTFDTEEKISITSSGVDDRSAKLVINPYDEYALEEALRIRELHGGQVLAVTCGPERSQEALRTALAIGADEAIRIEGSELAGDSYSVAASLAAVIAPLQPDLLLAGLFAVDTGSGSVALQVAQRLGLPHASAAVKVTLLTSAELAAQFDSAEAGGLAAQVGVNGLSEASSSAAQDASDEAGLYKLAASWAAERFALVERDVEGDTETVVLPLPALITAQQGLNEPRYPSLPGIMKAKRKPLRVVEASELATLIGSSQARLGSAWQLPAAGEAAGQAGDAAVRTLQNQLLPPPPRAAGQKLAGAPAEQAAKLVALLRSEAKLF